jgi:hypothetical protein
MKKTFLFVLVTFVISLNSYCQLSKGTWLIGGIGNFSLNKETTYYPEANRPYPKDTIVSEVITMKVSPTIGYFFIDKLAIGLKPTCTWVKMRLLSTTLVNDFDLISINNIWFEAGPFVRYYFLNSGKPYNILTEVNYQYGFHSNGMKREASDNYYKSNTSTFSISAGPVIYFNKSISLELLLGWFQQNEGHKGEYKIKQKGLQTGIGLQIHFKKQ